MPIHLHRSNRTEALVETLCRVLTRARSPDPFDPFPIVVGSRGMERWLRHEIATRLDIAVGLAFPFPRQAIAGAAHWLLDPDATPGQRFWELTPAAQDRARRWERDALTVQLVGLLREDEGEPEFRAVRRYLREDRVGSDHGPVSARELLFAGEVAEVLDRLMHDRPDDAIKWADDPSGTEPDHRWLAVLLSRLGASEDDASPAVLHRELTAARARATGRAMAVFGLSTIGPGDRQRLAAIARSVDVHLFVLSPTHRWSGPDGTENNPVLTSLGSPGRDVHAWLEEVTRIPDLLVDSEEAEAPTTLLRRLQSWILSSDGPSVPDLPWTADGSVSAHSTFGAMRQCEVLRDELLALFAADPSLEPRDVVVMTPDIESYAPLVEAVFSRTGAATPGTGARLPRIPVAIADLGVRRTNAVAEVALQVLEVAGDRLTASWLVDFLSLEPVRTRWSLDDDDLADLRRLIQESGLRWGSDAADRLTVDQPAQDQNTVRFALERLALGVVMPDEDPLGVVPAPGGGLAPAVPLEVQGRRRVHRVGRLAAVLRSLTAHRSAMTAPAPLLVWRDRIVSALDALAATSETTSWLRSEVDATLDDLASVSPLLGQLEVERSAVLRWLQGRFELPQRGDRPITGAVQVCALEPMRSVPFRVVALLGMDDRAFPRGDRPRTWDPMGERRPGERDRREVDRHLLLEAILCARERLLLLWSGHDVQQGKDQPAAVPVEELLECLAQLTASEREELVREHPLQPWSARNFGRPPDGHDHGMADAARRLGEIAAGRRQAGSLGLAASATTDLPTEQFLPQTLTLTELADALLAPHRLLLRDRLGLAAIHGDPDIEDREPLELDSLETWSLRRRMVDHLLVDPTGWSDEALVDALEARVAGEGLLPTKAGGRAILTDEVQKARQLITNLAQVDGQPLEPIELSVATVHGPALTGRVDHVIAREGELLLGWHTPSSGANDRLKLIAWLHLLAAIASGRPVAAARLVGYGSTALKSRAGGDFLVFPGGGDEALSALEGLLAIWRVARNRPIPLFRNTSAGAARELARCGDDPTAPGAHSRLVAAVADGWHGGFRSTGDVEDPWIRTFFVDYDPTAHLDDEREFGLLTLARRVWLPIVHGEGLGQRLRGAWRPGEDR